MTTDSPVDYDDYQTLFKPYADRLASFIDSMGSGHPLVSGLPKRVGDGFLWQYTNYDFIVYTTATKRVFPEHKKLLSGSPDCNVIQLLSAEEGLRLIEITESIRQNTSLPMAYLSRSLGVAFED